MRRPAALTPNGLRGSIETAAVLMLCSGQTEVHGSRAYMWPSMQKTSFKSVSNVVWITCRSDEGVILGCTC